MRVAVVGSRTFGDYKLMCEVLDNMNISEIVSGGARGADKLAERYASERGLSTRVFKANWKKHGIRAGYIRNHDIINNCDVVVAFWDGKSKGTKHSIDLADKVGKDVYIVSSKD